ncbi:tRNA (adenosine(37)-N6)-dimethylallyltransferase MiaA [Oceaniovalibus guishaninsula]|nr:tRNA (adenosine(37)-N6)-dimethylallyltransferase MiaA [Oceaniovalibus guishaninsula]
MDSHAAIAAARGTAHILVAGPTASGKSALALAIARAHGGTIVNADALQVYRGWPILTAQPNAADRAAAPHALYGHVPDDAPYSVGLWLAEVAALAATGARLIVTGGTGLYFRALTEGLAPVPPVPPQTRAEADAHLADGGIGALLADLDPATAARIDTRNPARVQRAWEVLRATGRGLADWQDATPPPLMPLDTVLPLRLDMAPDRLNPRIARRFDAMLAQGALDEARARLPRWTPRAPSSQAIGAAQLVAHLRGEMSLGDARDLSIVATRQFAKRQRTWFRARMRNWQAVAPDMAR